MTNAELDQLAINTIRTLSIDAVQQAKSGHPGTPMALAPLVYTIWNRVMNFDPQDPIWPNRDRFVLSNGHASMLLWSILHLTGVQAVNADYELVGHPSVTLDDIRRFRQLDSKAPGHPEYHWVSGVETTTGPLGQGVATSVGMAIAQRWLACIYNKNGYEIFDYNIYAVCGSGTTTISPSRAIPGSRLPKMLPLGSWPMDGTYCVSAMPMMSIGSSTRCVSSSRPRNARHLSCSTATSDTGRRTSKTRQRHTVNHWAMKKFV